MPEVAKVFPLPSSVSVSGGDRRSPRLVPRDPQLQHLYLDHALRHIPRLLGNIDRNPYRPTYGCLDRQFWHYRTADFPSEMYQEGVLPLALVYALPLPGNRWYLQPRVRELAVAALRFVCRWGRRDGSCDDYYPYERALGAAVFSLQAAARAYQVLGLHDEEILNWLARRGRWVAQCGESGRLTNHHALAALGLARLAEILPNDTWFRSAAERRARQVLGWQSPEGWFDEYDGADPGYQTITLDCLAKLRRLWPQADWLDEPLRRGVAFARHFLHPDGSYGGEYGSRGTCHFYPHGMELLAARCNDAADLADGFLAALQRGRHGWFDDDRLFAHRLANLIEAHEDFSPVRPAAPPQHAVLGAYFPQAGLLVRRGGKHHAVVSAARGGIVKLVGYGPRPITDAGLIVELHDGRVAVSQWHDRTRHVHLHAPDGLTGDLLLQIAGPLHLARWETATPAKLVLFRLGLLTAGRVCRTLVRRLLQRRLITGRQPAPVRLTRCVELFRNADGRQQVRVTDHLELVRRNVSVRRMAYGTDHQSAYVAACGVYQDSVLEPWTDLSEYVGLLNTQRRVTITRDWSCLPVAADTC